jgi:hypothetical protein
MILSTCFGVASLMAATLIAAAAAPRPNIVLVMADDMGFFDRAELYHLAKDRTETRSLAAAQPERVSKLTETYDAWAKRAGVLSWPLP